MSGQKFEKRDRRTHALSIKLLFCLYQSNQEVSNHVSYLTLLLWWSINTLMLGAYLTPTAVKQGLVHFFTSVVLLILLLRFLVIYRSHKSDAHVYLNPVLDRLVPFIFGFVLRPLISYFFDCDQSQNMIDTAVTSSTLLLPFYLI